MANTEAVKKSTKCMKRHKNPDGTFKGGWDGCISAFKNCRKDVDDPEAMCAYIKNRKGAVTARVASQRIDLNYLLDKETEAAYRFAKIHGASDETADDFSEAVEAEIWQSLSEQG